MLNAIFNSKSLTKKDENFLSKHALLSCKVQQSRLGLAVEKKGFFYGISPVLISFCLVFSSKCCTTNDILASIRFSTRERLSRVEFLLCSVSYWLLNSNSISKQRNILVRLFWIKISPLWQLGQRSASRLRSNQTMECCREWYG